MSLLVTGGAGFVGSHFVRAAHDRTVRLVVLDDLSNGSPESRPSQIELVRGDCGDRELVRRLIRQHEVTAVAHFAGKIQVGESVREPRAYFEANVVKTLALLDVLLEERVDTVLFSSSAAVYAASESAVDEAHTLAPGNPYGMSKLSIEHVLASYGVAYKLRWAALRYFNAAGAHPDGSLRECHEPETHLIPLAVDAALGRRPALSIFGDDYPTRDGTAIRDYVHVCDLADAHLATLEALAMGIEVGATNLGTGDGFSVREVLDTCERVIGRPVPHQIGARRRGDPAMLVASAQRARQLLGWTPARSELSVIIEDTLRSRRS
jgi:UDP-glucose-4-epimerase GalE